MKLLMVSVGSGRFAVVADAVWQIVDPGLDSGFRPGTPEDGAMLGGERYPVLDLHALTGERPLGTCVYLLLGGDGRRVALPVDAAEAIRDIAPDDIAPLPSFIFSRERRLFRGIFTDGRVPRLLLDERAIL
jgi:chemotaxis signal transduction protein